jgi:hypothetical protein
MVFEKNKLKSDGIYYLLNQKLYKQYEIMEIHEKIGKVL